MTTLAQASNTIEALPAFTLCYTVILTKPAGENIGIVKYGECGYNPTNLDFGMGKEAQDAVRNLNEKRGIDADTQLDWEIKSMFVWK